MTLGEIARAQALKVRGEIDWEAAAQAVRAAVIDQIVDALHDDASHLEMSREQRAVMACARNIRGLK